MHGAAGHRFQAMDPRGRPESASPAGVLRQFSGSGSYRNRAKLKERHSISYKPRASNHCTLQSCNGDLKFGAGGGRAQKMDQPTAAHRHFHTAAIRWARSARRTRPGLAAIRAISAGGVYHEIGEFQFSKVPVLLETYTEYKRTAITNKNSK